MVLMKIQVFWNATLYQLVTKFPNSENRAFSIFTIFRRTLKMEEARLSVNEDI